MNDVAVLFLLETFKFEERSRTRLNRVLPCIQNSNKYNSLAQLCSSGHSECIGGVFCFDSMAMRPHSSQSSINAPLSMKVTHLFYSYWPPCGPGVRGKEGGMGTRPLRHALLNGMSLLLSWSFLLFS